MFCPECCLIAEVPGSLGVYGSNKLFISEKKKEMLELHCCMLVKLSAKQCIHLIKSSPYQNCIFSIFAMFV